MALPSLLPPPPDAALPLADYAHLLRRAGFGPRPAELLAPDRPRTRRAAVDGLLQAAAGPPVPLPLDAAEFTVPTDVLKRVQRRRDLTKEQKKALRQRQRALFQQLNTAWFDRLTTAPDPLREKLTLFWHGHFATRAQRPDWAWRQNETFRRLALGKFGDLLRALLYDPALQTFLSNDRNRRAHPNENFGRELLELFTLGRGHYTEADVQAAARAFTGWQFERVGGEFAFNERQHDPTDKTFLGQTGPWRGEDIVRILLEQPRTAVFVTTKLYRYFVSDTVDAGRVATLATDFRASDYDVGALVRQMLTAEWFYTDPAVRAGRIKSPVELLVGLRRLVALDLPNPRQWHQLQRGLGQELFGPPNVAGWPGGRAWIDSSTLAFRLRLPQVLVRQGHPLEFALKDDNDVAPNMGEAVARPTVTGGAADLNALRLLAGPTTSPPDVAALAAVLLAVPPSAAVRSLFSEAEDFSALVVLVLSVPEYQLG